MTLDNTDYDHRLGAGQIQSRCAPTQQPVALTNDDIFAVTAREAGVWVPWSEWKKLPSKVPGKRVHAIMWRDGRVWDAFNGFRPPAKGEASTAWVTEVWKEYARVKTLLSGMRCNPEVFGDI